MPAELLKKVYLFEGLNMPELVEVLKVCRQVRFEEGRSIFLEGDAGDSCYVIEQGEVRISKHIPGAGEEALAVLKPGSYFGEMALINGAPRSASAIANTPTVCLVIDKAGLDGLIEHDKELGVKILWSFCRTLSNRVRDMNEKITSFLAMTVGFGGHV